MVVLFVPELDDDLPVELDAVDFVHVFVAFPVPARVLVEEGGLDGADVGEKVLFLAEEVPVHAEVDVFPVVFGEKLFDGIPGGFLDLLDGWLEVAA